MARIRNKKVLVNQNKLPSSFLGWIVFLLENIGRLSYKLAFFVFKTIALACYYAIYAVFFFTRIFIQIIVLTFNKGAVVLKKTASIIKKSLQKLILLFKQIKIPFLKLPQFKKIKTPAFLKKLIVFKKTKLLCKKQFLKTKTKLAGKKIRLTFKTVVFLGFGTTGLILAGYFYINILKDLPNPDRLITRDQAVSTKIYDNKNRLLFTVFNGSQNRTLVKLEDIPQVLVQATIAIEDKDFYKHPGFSLRGISRAIWKNISEDELQGGSTITQQLIKNALLTPEKSWKRKLKELILSIQAELVFSKDEILQMYLNEVPYGGTAYGVEEASQTYFAKSVKQLNLAEASLLAGLPAAPTRFSPFGANPQLALIRQHQVLDAISKNGYITPEEAQNAKKEKIVLAPQQTNIKAPHFVMYVKDLLVQKYGTKMVEQGGLRVYTSLDLDIQEMAQEKVAQEIEKLVQMRISNGAALITNPQTGEILAMVGSKNYYDRESDGNVNVTIMPRQPGSSIKVITYSLALANGFSPATTISDTPITYKIPGAESYSPKNYDNSFHGNVTLRTALACSYNVPAVKTLAVFGVNNMIDLAQSMGITTWNDRSRYGLALTLGAGEVKMTDMAVVYGTLANMGKKVNLNPILKVTDSKGKILSEFSHGSSQKILDQKVAFLITDILKDNQARTPAFGPASLLVIPENEVAVKTGTTNDKKDNWTIGYTQDFVATVWVGNNNNTPMSSVASGITGASPIWHSIVKELLKNKEPHKFNPPENLIKVKVCSINGLLPCEGCPTKEEYFVKGTEPKQHCSSENIKKIIEEQKEKQKDPLLNGQST
jgi:1A family penicillin-binding protein